LADTKTTDYCGHESFIHLTITVIIIPITILIFTERRTLNTDLSIIGADTSSRTYSKTTDRRVDHKALVDHPIAIAVYAITYLILIPNRGFTAYARLLTSFTDTWLGTCTQSTTQRLVPLIDRTITVFIDTVTISVFTAGFRSITFDISLDTGIHPHTGPQSTGCSSIRLVVGAIAIIVDTITGIAQNPLMNLTVKIITITSQAIRPSSITIVILI